jgi:uroporphyrin-3 C-methyltransferase
MSETDTEPTAQAIPPAEPSRGMSAQSLALIVALAALALLAWQWLDNRQRLNAMEYSLTQKLSEFDTRNRESELLAKQAQESSTQTAARLALLDQKLAESQSQQDALQTLYQEFANNRDERLVAEAEQLLVMASEQLQLAGNLKSALMAMQTADMRLQQIDKPQAIQLRKLIGRDIERLQAVPAVDIVGTSLRLEGMAAAVEKLPLISEHHPHNTSDQLAPDYETNAWRRLAGEVWHDIRQLVRVERIDRPEPPLLTPEQSFFLRENLRLRLLTARIALLQHDDSSYHADLRAADDWLKRHFDTSDQNVQATLATIRQLASNIINIQLPDISESLNAASRYKLSLEKGSK